MLIQMQGVVYQGAHIAMHREMELGIVSLDGSKEFIDTDFGVQLLSYLAPERLDWAFPGFYLAARKLPLIFKLSVFALGANTFPSRIMTADLLMPSSNGCIWMCSDSGTARPGLRELLEDTFCGALHLV